MRYQATISNSSMAEVNSVIMFLFNIFLLCDATISPENEVGKITSTYNI